MEHKAPEAMQVSKGAQIVENLRTWSHDHLTLKGREDALFVKKYQSVIEQMPKDITEGQMAFLEMKLRQQAHSAAIGSIIVDGLVTGGVLVGGGVLLRKLDFKMPHVERKHIKAPKKGTAEVAKNVVQAVGAKPEANRSALSRITSIVTQVAEGHGENLELPRLSVKGFADAMKNGAMGFAQVVGWVDGQFEKLADRMW